MARKLYVLLTTISFCLPTNQGAAVVYVQSQVPGQPVNNAPLTRTEQASIESLFNRRKHYFLSMQNIERACFTALDASINSAFKVSNNPNIWGWHAGMQVLDILDQLSATYGQPTPAVLEANNHIFRSPTLAANAPKVLFCHIKECTQKALLGQNPYTDKQLITNTIRLLLTTGLYVRVFKDWDQLLEPNKTWIELHWMIQEAFQHWLNATAPTASHQGYAPALPFQQNAFRALAGKDLDDDSADTIAAQMAALTYQSQLTVTTATNSSQRMDQYTQTPAHQQEQLQKNQHQIMEQMAALSFNQSNAGQGIGCQRRSPPPPGAPFVPIQFRGNNFGGQGGQGCGRGRGCGCGRGPPAFTARRTPPLMSITAGRVPAFAGAHPAAGGGYYTPARQANTQMQPYSNLTKKHANWNACYSCGFNVAKGHTSQTCPHHLRRPDHNEYFTQQNSQQYINAGYNCSTKLCHKTVSPQM